MADHVPIGRMYEVVIDDPVEVRRIDRLEAEAERDIARMQKRRKRSPGGRVLHVRVNSEELAELEKRAERDSVSIDVAAKRALLEGLDNTGHELPTTAELWGSRARAEGWDEYGRVPSENPGWLTWNPRLQSRVVDPAYTRINFGLPPARRAAAQPWAFQEPSLEPPTSHTSATVLRFRSGPG